MKDEKIKALRKELEMNQRQFAKHLGISRGHISSIETGSAKPSEQLLKLINLTFCDSSILKKEATANPVVCDGDKNEKTVQQVLETARLEIEQLTGKKVIEELIKLDGLVEELIRLAKVQFRAFDVASPSLSDKESSIHRPHPEQNRED